MPWKITDGHVINAETGRQANKKPLPKERLKKLLGALYANASKSFDKGQPRDDNGRWTDRLRGAITGGVRGAISNYIKDAADVGPAGYKPGSKKFNPGRKLYRKTETNKKLEKLAGTLASLENFFGMRGGGSSGTVRGSRTGQVIDRILQRFKEFNSSQVRYPKGSELGGQWRKTGGGLKTASQVSNISGGFSEGKEVIQAVESVQKLPDKFGKVSIRKEGRLGKGYEGMYNPITRSIKISDRAPGKYIAVAHEFGHAVACQGLSSCYLKDKKFDALNKSIDDSPTIKKWEGYQKSGIIPVGNSKLRVSPNYFKYFLNSNEKFARAYSQYIGYKTKNRNLLKDLDNDRKSKVPRQWPDSEFGPIAREFDRLFEQEGWKP